MDDMDMHLRRAEDKMLAKRQEGKAKVDAIYAELQAAKAEYEAEFGPITYES